MYGRPSVFSFLVSSAVLAALVRPATGAPLKKALVYDKAGWYVHPDIPKINDHLKKMGADNGFQVDVTSNPADFNAAKLAGYEVLILNNISEMGTSVQAAAQRSALQAWIENGGGLVAFHGSGVVRGTWDWYINLLGTDWYYDAAMQEARVFIPPDARSLPISAGVPLEGRLSDEWNNFKVNVDTLPAITVVLAIDETSYDPTRKKNPSEGNGVAGFRMADPAGRWLHPVSWVRQAGKGRVFYSCIGHDINVMSTPFATAHFLKAIQWAAGDLEAPTGLEGFPGVGPAKQAGARALEGGRIEFRGEGDYVLEVFSPGGRRVLKVSGRGPALHALKDRLPAGIYRVRAASGTRVLHVGRLAVL